ncbi:MAG: dual specificity protein phosphatase family protein [Fimbriimonas sp.]|nr:dual specificity protein phosphatase family protein [Fimbriimonas sp.]
MPDFRWIDVPSTGRLAITPHPLGDEALAEDLSRMRSAGVDVLVSMLGRQESEYLGLSEEPVMCAKAGLEFVQAPIIDQSVPDTPKQLHRVATKLVDRLTTGRNVVIHCRMGIGRSSVMAACVMTLQGIEPDEAFERISVARGIRVPDTLAQKLWVAAFAATFASRE